MQYEVYAYNAKLQTVRIIVATPALAKRKAASLENRLNKRCPYLPSAKSVIEERAVVTPVYGFEDELL